MGSCGFTAKELYVDQVAFIILNVVNDLEFRFKFPFFFRIMSFLND